ncbi:MAG TPA: glycerol-3-phosphate 1-O-acyltransferase PlsY [Anaeromyxobacter sp.]
MSDLGLAALLVLAGYLAGSIPFGYVLGRLVLGVDVRQVGSGNIGGTNVARAGGKGLGVATIVLDALKAIVPILLARRFLGDAPRAELLVVAVAIAAFVGHLFPVWLGFRGGKGVATALGIFVVLAPWAALAGIVAYAIAYGATRISSVGSLAGTATCATAAFVLNGPSRPVSWAGVVLAALIVLRHRENIRRLLTGEERRKMRV